MADIIVFGDSLSDTGNSLAATGIPPAPFYFNGRFSNGSVAVEYLDTQLQEFTLVQANNFAFGGATTGRGNSNEDNLGADLPGLQDQIDAFATRVGSGTADATDLYIVWAGPNNFLDVLGSESALDPTVPIRQGVVDLANSLRRLGGLGATNLVLPNMLNLGRLPAAQEFSADAAAVTLAFNAALALEVGNLRLGSPTFQITEVDVFATGEAIATNPSAFGFTNITEPLIFKVPPPADAAGHFFWDPFHPTTQGHQAFGNTLTQAITGQSPQPTFNNIAGTGRGDLLLGTGASDNIDGFAGNDVLRGRGRGDRLEAWNGNDQIFGDGGDDTLSGGRGVDNIFSGAGNDVAFGGNENDRILGDAGADVLLGDNGNDQMSGGDDNDYLMGGQGLDTLLGDRGQDTLNGGRNNDVLTGGAGNDRLDGGAERDRLIGGAGRDVFVYRRSSSVDIVADFQRGTDQIDLRSFAFDNFADFQSSVSLSGNAINFGNSQVLRLLLVDVAQLTGTDFIFA